MNTEKNVFSLVFFFLLLLYTFYVALSSSSLFLVYGLAQSAHLILHTYIRQRQFSIEQYRIVKFININRYIQNGKGRNHHDNQTCSHFVVVSGRLFPPLIRFFFVLSFSLSPSIHLSLYTYLCESFQASPFLIFH